MRLHRISAAIHALTEGEAFSGRGGLFGKGRWHTLGRPIVYTAQHVSLAMAEALVHIQRSNSLVPFNRWVIDVPDRFIARHPVLPKAWVHDDAIAQPIGDAWLASNSSPALLVPSAVVNEEMNCLLNPAHPFFDLKWVVSGPHAFFFVPRPTRP